MNAMGGVARRMLGAPMLEGDIFTEHDRGHSLRKRCLLLKGSTTQLRVPYPLSPLCPLSIRIVDCLLTLPRLFGIHFLSF